MNVTFEHVGTCIAYGQSPDAAVVRITSVNRMGYNPSICVESWDGHGDIWISSMFASLDDITADWRPATDEETAKFERLYQPAPQNWN
ncbi:hypothetical protein ACR6C2_16895 [Streptomyces sp. INA 01156]